MADFVSEMTGTLAGQTATVSVLVAVSLLVVVVSRYLAAELTLGRKRRAVAAAEAEPGTCPTGPVFPWLAWAFDQIHRRRATSVADRAAVAAELNRDLEATPGYGLVAEVGQYLPVCGIIFTAATAAVVFGTYKEMPADKVPWLLVISAGFMLMALVNFLFTTRLRGVAGAVEAAALRWFDGRAADLADDPGDEVRRALAELVQPLARLDARSTALERAVVTLADAGTKVAEGLVAQKQVLNTLAPLADELRQLRESNGRVGLAAEQTAEAARRLLAETTDQARQFGAAVGAFSAGLAVLETGQRGVADAQTRLAGLLELVGSGLGDALAGVARAQAGLDAETRELAEAGGRLRATVDQAGEAFRECGVRVQGAAAGLAEPVDALTRGAEVWRAAIDDQVVPASRQQGDAAAALLAAAKSIAATAEGLAGGSDDVARAAADLRAGHGQVTAAAGGLAAALGGVEEVMAAAAAAGHQLEVAAAALPPAVSRLDRTVESAGQTVERLDGANSRLADGFEQRLAAFDQNALRPAVGSLRELDGVCTDLRRDLDFSGVMDDLVAATQALWRAAQDQQDAARALRHSRGGWRLWPFGRSDRGNGRIKHEEETP